MALTKNSQIDLNGNEMILDADADTSITADTDDQIDIKVGGTDTVVITGGAMALKGATPTLTIGDAGAEDTKIVFDGNAQDYYIGLDDSADDLIIGRGSTVGTTPNIEINESNEIHFSSGDSDVKVFIGSEGGAFGGNSSHNIRASGNDFIFNSADDFMYESGGTEVMRLLNDGNLLLGATSATASEVRVDVQYSANPIIQVKDTTNDIAVWMQATDSVAAIVAPQNNPLVFNVGASQAEKARFDSNGDFAIRTTDTTAALTVSQTDNDNPVARFDIACGALNAIVGMQLRVTAGTANAANKYFLQGDDNGNTRVELRTDGSIYSSYYTITSDERLKENIEDCEPMLEKLKQVRIVDFDWKENAGPEGRQRGVIAQEIESIFPELIHEPVEYKEFKKSEMMPILVKAIQEQQTLIEDLKARIETLEGGE